MDIEKLASYLKNEELMDSAAMSETMHLLEKHPYFQIGHMLLLRAMQSIQPENYNKQLKISGSFISDKKKLFEFINKPLPVKEKETAVKKKEDVEKKTDIFEKKEVKSIAKTLPHKQELEGVKEDVVKEAAEVESDKIKTNVNKETKDDNKKVVEVINPEKKHEKIVKDFFHQQIVSYSGVNKNEDSQEEKTFAKEKVAKLEKEDKDDGKKEVEIVDARQLIEAKKAAAKKKVESTINQTSEKKVEVRVEKKIDTESSVNRTEEKGGMNDIFSKIRKIKKEMNVEPETGIKSSEKIVSKVETENVKPVEKKSVGGRVIKESFIGFEENTTDDLQKAKNEIQEEIKDEKSDIEETVEIKESELTAKDLFKKHKLNKGDSDEKIVEKEEKETVLESGLKENDSDEGKETIIESRKLIKKEDSEEESAADALLKRIAAKKERMRQEKIQEEEEKELAQKRELEEVEKIIKESSKKQESTTVEGVGERQKEGVETVEEAVDEVVEENSNKEETVIKKPSVKIKKANNLIDSFIKKADSLERIGSKDSKLTGDISIGSAVESEEIMTETYADLLIQQKKYPKAIDVYNKLILKYPEKKTYFAIQIKKVESLIK